MSCISYIAALHCECVWRNVYFMCAVCLNHSSSTFIIPLISLKCVHLSPAITPAPYLSIIGKLMGMNESCFIHFFFFVFIIKGTIECFPNTVSIKKFSTQPIFQFWILWTNIFYVVHTLVYKNSKMLLSKLISGNYFSFSPHMFGGHPRNNIYAKVDYFKVKYFECAHLLAITRATRLFEHYKRGKTCAPGVGVEYAN